MISSALTMFNNFLLNLWLLLNKQCSLNDFETINDHVTSSIHSNLWSKIHPLKIYMEANSNVQFQCPMHLGVGDGYLFDLRLQWRMCCPKVGILSCHLRLLWHYEIQLGNLKNKLVLMPLTCSCDKSTHVVKWLWTIMNPKRIMPCLTLKLMQFCFRWTRAHYNKHTRTYVRQRTIVSCIVLQS